MEKSWTYSYRWPLHSICINHVRKWWAFFVLCKFQNGPPAKLFFILDHCYCIVPQCSVTLAPPPRKNRSCSTKPTNHSSQSSLIVNQSINQPKGLQWKSTLDWLIESTVGKIAPRGWFPGGSKKWPNTARQYSMLVQRIPVWLFFADEMNRTEYHFRNSNLNFSLKNECFLAVHLERLDRSGKWFIFVSTETRHTWSKRSKYVCRVWDCTKKHKELAVGPFKQSKVVLFLSLLHFASHIQSNEHWMIIWRTNQGIFSPFAVLMFCCWFLALAMTFCHLVSKRIVKGFIRRDSVRMRRTFGNSQRTASVSDGLLLHDERREIHGEMCFARWSWRGAPWCSPGWSGYAFVPRPS